MFSAHRFFEWPRPPILARDLNDPVFPENRVFSYRYSLIEPLGGWILRVSNAFPSGVGPPNSPVVLLGRFPCGRGLFVSFLTESFTLNGPLYIFYAPLVCGPHLYADVLLFPKIPTRGFEVLAAVYLIPIAKVLTLSTSARGSYGEM